MSSPLPNASAPPAGPPAASSESVGVEQGKVNFSGTEKAQQQGTLFASPKQLAGITAPANTPEGSGRNTPLGSQGSLTPSQGSKKGLGGVPRVSSPLVLSSKQGEDVVKQVREKLDEIALAQDDDSDDADDDEDAEETEIHPDNLPMVEKITPLEAELEEIRQQYYLSRKKLEQEFRAKFDVVYDKRRDLIAEFGPEKAPEDQFKFWLNALSHHPALREMITEEDVEALNCLTDIRVVDVPDQNKFGYKLDFHFDENRFFTNSVLSKVYYISNYYDPNDSCPVLDSVESSTIDWKNSLVNLTEAVQSVRRKGRNGKTITKEIVQPIESFFNFFNIDWHDTAEEVDPESPEYAERMELASQDFDIAEVIRRRIVPQALAWFSGRGEDEDYDDDDEEWEDELGDVSFHPNDSEASSGSDDDSDDSDDDDSNSDSESATKDSNKPQYNVGSGADGQQECKQQ